MKQYIIREEAGSFLIGHIGWFKQWKTDWSFDYISDLMDFVSKCLWLGDPIWEFPQPTFQKSDKTPIGTGIVNAITLYSYLSGLVENKNFDTKTADLCFVYCDKENEYKVIDRPYDSFENPFKRIYCLPCWSLEAFPKYSEAFAACQRVEDEKIRTNTRYFYHLDEYEEWRNENPHVKILSFKDTSGPWSSFAYEVSYEYKNADRPKTI